MVRTSVIALLALALPLPNAWAQTSRNSKQIYGGEDAGMVLLSFGAEEPTQISFAIEPDEKNAIKTPAKVSNTRPHFTKPDYSVHFLNTRRSTYTASRGVELRPTLYTGGIKTAVLAPGNYVVRGLSVSTSGSAPTFYVTSSQSIQSEVNFEIFPGKTTYLGRFLAILVPFQGSIGYSIYGKKLPPFAGWDIIREDHQQEDLALATAKAPVIGELIATRTGQ